MMADEYIRREDALGALFAPGMCYAPMQLKIIKDLPAADVADVVHGKWCDNGIAGSMLVKCSVCGFDCGANSFSYCTTCGAKMDGGDGNSDMT